MEMPLESALSFWWRVKNWTVDSAALTVGPDDFGNYNEVDLPTGEMTLQVPESGIASEKELVCNIERQFGVGGGIVGGSYAAGIFLRIRPGAKKSGDLLKMNIDLLATTGPEVWWLVDGSPAESEIGTATINLDGQALQFPISGPETWTASVEISATEYWPYDPDDGLGPTYDKTTGKALR